MKMIFKLSEKQLERAKQMVIDSNAAHRCVIGEFPIEQWTTKNGTLIGGYYDDVRNHYYVWTGVLGFLRVASKSNIPDLSITISMSRLIVIGVRDIITNSEVVEKISRILGKNWRVAEPEIDGECLAVRLFWWESMEHYVQWRSNWDTYFSWLALRVDPEKGIQKFDDRFRDENQCLQLLKSGKLIEARQRFPKLADQILTIA